MTEQISVQDLKQGDSFRYIHDWDFLGRPQYSDWITASDDPIIVNNRTVVVPIGGDDGRCFMSQVDKKVDIFRE